MLVLCNQAFTNDTFMQLVNDKAGILLQYKLEVIHLCIRECPKFMFMGGGQIFFGPVVRGTRKKLTVSEGRSTRIFYHYTRQIISQKRRFIHVLRSFSPSCVSGLTSMWRGAVINLQGPDEESGSYRLALGGPGFFSCLWMKISSPPSPDVNFGRFLGTVR